MAVSEAKCAYLLFRMILPENCCAASSQDDESGSTLSSAIEEVWGSTTWSKRLAVSENPFCGATGGMSL